MKSIEEMQSEIKKLRSGLDEIKDVPIFAHRIAYGCGYLKKGNLLEEYIASHKLSFEQLDELVAIFADNELKMLLVVKMMMTASLFKRDLSLR